MTKRCAVCGDTTPTNVRMAWRRERDGKTVNICCACAEADRVNENTIDNHTSDDTLFNSGVTAEDHKWTKWCHNSGVRSAFKGRRVRA